MPVPQFLLDLLQLLFDLAVPAAFCTLAAAGVSLRHEGGINFHIGGRTGKWILWTVILLTIPQLLSWIPTCRVLIEACMLSLLLVGDVRLRQLRISFKCAPGVRSEKGPYEIEQVPLRLAILEQDKERYAQKRHDELHEDVERYGAAPLLCRHCRT